MTNKPQPPAGWVEVPSMTKEQVSALIHANHPSAISQHNRTLWLGIRRGVMQIIAALDAHYGVKDK